MFSGGIEKDQGMKWVNTSFIFYLFTLYSPLSKKTNNNLQNKYIKLSHVWLQIIAHNWLFHVNYQGKDKI